MSADSPATVAVYRRTVTSPMREVWENVLDWEHLPWLHRTTFSDIKLLESGPWGWRARVGLQPAEDRREVLIDLRIDRPGQRYVTRTVEGPGEGAEIWTHLAPTTRGARGSPSSSGSPGSTREARPPWVRPTLGSTHSSGMRTRP